MDRDDSDSAVLDALSGSLDEVTMRTPLARIEAAGRALRRRRRVARTATGLAAVAVGVGAGVPMLNHPSTAPPGTAEAAGAVHVRTVGYSVDTAADGTIRVEWDKERYFNDREGLQRALRQAGFPVLIKVGEFCVGPGDDASLDASGTGPGVERVVQAVQTEQTPASGDRPGSRQQPKDGGTHRDGGKGVVTFVFSPAAMPQGKQLFIGYLSPSQLAVTHGAPGSVERLISRDGPLTCTTQAPPSHYVAHDTGPRRPAPEASAP